MICFIKCSNINVPQVEFKAITSSNDMLNKCFLLNINFQDLNIIIVEIESKKNMKVFHSHQIHHSYNNRHDYSNRTV